MPRTQPHFECPLKRRVYEYLVVRNITYERGAKIFGFNSKQSFNAWIHRKGTSTEVAQRVEKYLANLDT